MKAIVIHRFGGANQLQMETVATPEPDRDEVLIAIACAGVNPVDWKIRDGMLESLFPHRFPLIPGWDAAGTVAAVGAGVHGFAEGDRVFAYCRKPVVQWGTYAEYVAMPAAAVAAMPASLGFAEAAAIPLAGLTSWQALFDDAGLASGQALLVLSGAGGTGSLAIPFAKNAGARVYALASPANHDYVRSLGADDVFDYHAPDALAAVRAREPSGVDVVYANVGGPLHREAYGILRPGGTLVSIVDPPDQAAAEAAGVIALFRFVEPDGTQLGEIARLVDQGIVRPPEITLMRLEEAAAAQARNQDGHVRGKIVLEVS
ncbi:MAG: NADP-dependent oxidoreductase [Rhodospirillales bacterium]|nr:MAG: NADP-dependent oxidoreductase [Rhodospirillales bacterium]